MGKNNEEKKPYSIRDYLLIFAFEVFGTLILLLGINFNNGNNALVATGLFMAAMYCAKISGAHFNGAVSIGVYILEGKYKDDFVKLLVYLLAETVGGYFGMTLSLLILGKDNIACVKPQDDSFSPLYIFMIELFFTTIFMTGIFHNIYAEKIGLATD